MSVWVFVKCICPNRRRLGESRLDDFVCGRTDGAIISTSPNSLITYGYDFERIYKHQPEMFEVWRKLPKWRRYSHRYDDLHFLSDEALMWQLEIEQLQRFLSGEEFMGWDELQLWNKIREEERFSYARANDKPPDVVEVLETGLSLCQASQETGNPIEFS